uniref:Uncharacterized protein n=1 Tax=Tanacetum cinerariifolium TaxID=118510 RepID=A0A699GFL2_TANCI|nr:hypothetical protein [Tanacetum cinerariifolium]
MFVEFWVAPVSALAAWPWPSWALALGRALLTPLLGGVVGVVCAKTLALMHMVASSTGSEAIRRTFAHAQRAAEEDGVQSHQVVRTVGICQPVGGVCAARLHVRIVGCRHRAACRAAPGGRDRYRRRLRAFTGIANRRHRDAVRGAGGEVADGIAGGGDRGRRCARAVDVHVVAGGAAGGIPRERHRGGRGRSRCQAGRRGQRWFAAHLELGDAACGRGQAGRVGGGHAAGVGAGGQVVRLAEAGAAAGRRVVDGSGAVQHDRVAADVAGGGAAHGGAGAADSCGRARFHLRSRAVGQAQIIFVPEIHHERRIIDLGAVDEVDVLAALAGRPRVAHAGHRDFMGAHLAVAVQVRDVGAAARHGLGGALRERTAVHQAHGGRIERAICLGHGVIVRAPDGARDLRAELARIAARHRPAAIGGRAGRVAAWHRADLQCGGARWRTCIDAHAGKHVGRQATHDHGLAAARGQARHVHLVGIDRVLRILDEAVDEVEQHCVVAAAGTGVAGIGVIPAMVVIHIAGGVGGEDDGAVLVAHLGPVVAAVAAGDDVAGRRLFAAVQHQHEGALAADGRFAGGPVEEAGQVAAVDGVGRPGLLRTPFAGAGRGAKRRPGTA